MPIFEKIAQDPELDHGDDGKLQITLDRSDDPEAFACLLNIVHYKFNIPQNPSVELLYNLAILADKYGCEHLLTIFYGGWLDALSITAENIDASGEIALELAWIGHVFKRRDVECAGLQQLVRNLTQRDGDLVTPTGKLISDAPIHSSMKVKIMVLRQKAITKILGQLKDRLDDLLLRVSDHVLPKTETDGRESKTNKDFKFCHSIHPNDARYCETIIFGSAVATLMRDGLYPMAITDSFPGTLDQLCEKLGHLGRIKYPEDAPPHACRHLSCGLRLDTVVDLESLEDLVGDDDGNDTD
jgi:hypothetical protein